MTLPCRVNNSSGLLKAFPDLFSEYSPLIWTLPELFSNAFWTERSQTEHSCDIFYSPPRRIVLDQVGKQAPLSHYPELGSDQTVIDLMTIRVAMQCLAEITYLSAETDHGENPFLSHVRSEGSVEDFD